MTLMDFVISGNEWAIRNHSWEVQALNFQDCKGYTPLMYAAERGDYRVVSALCDAGADRDIRNHDGRKAVDIAALLGHSVVIVYLIKGGCGG